MKILFISIAIFSLCVIYPMQAQINSWYTNGPLGGDVSSVDVHPYSTDTIYANVDHLYKTTNGGQNWIQIADTSSEIIVDKVNPNIVYNINYSGIYKSIDSGQNWTMIANFRTISFFIDPQNSNRLYAGSSNGIVYKSLSGGNSWSQLSTTSIWDIKAIAVSNADSNFILAGMSGDWDFPGDGIYISTDGGITWQNSSTSFLYSNISNIVIDPKNPMIIYAGTVGSGMSSGEGIIKSTNGGQNWSFFNNGLLPYTSVISLTINPVHPNVLYCSANDTLGTSEMLHKSTDSGHNWFPVNTGINESSVYSIKLFQSNPDILFVGSRYGLLKSEIAGENLHLIGVKPVPVKSIFIDNNDPYRIYAIGTGVFKSIDQGIHWELINRGLSGGEIIYCDPFNRNILYAGTYSPYGAVYKSIDAGSNWSATSLEGVAINDIAVSLSNPNIVYAGGLADFQLGGIFKSNDAGNNWIMLTNQYVVFTIAINPFNSENILIGTHSQGIIQSLDGGNTWSPINNGISSPLPYIPDILIDPIDPNLMYCATYNSGVYKSIDGGNNWSSINNGLSNLDIRVLAFDTFNSILYAGTYGGGVFFSSDSGQSWTEINQGWQNAHVSDLSIGSAQNTNIIYASQYNEGVWKYLHTPTGIESNNQVIINNFVLFQNFPNPFNPITSIQYAISSRQVVKIKVYDVLGKEIATLVNEEKQPGEYEVEFHASALPSGVYFYQLRAGSFVETKKMILLL